MGAAFATANRGHFYIKERVKSTLIVKRVINLTDRTLLVYDRSGKLKKLEPEKLKLNSDGSLPILGFSTYLVVDQSVDQDLVLKFEKDEEYKKILVTPKRIGEDRKGEEIYRLINIEKSFYVAPTPADSTGYIGHFVAW